MSGPGVGSGTAAGSGAGPGIIRLTIPGWGPFVPTVHVGDRLVRVRYGTQDIPVVPGRTVVRAYVTAASEYGHAEVELDVAPGAVETVHYSPPWMYGLPGVMRRSAPTGWQRVAPSPAAGFLVVLVVAFVVWSLLR